MKKIQHYILLTISLLISSYPVCSQNKQADFEWFSDAKLGLFIHWGLYSQTAGEWKGKATKGGEHFMLHERIPIKEYELIANDFNPTLFDATKWVKTAKETGMKYVIITAKHHDGFAMYDSECSDYNIVTRSPFKRDPIKELADACQKEGLKFGVYYSLGRDWHDPDVPTNWPHKAGRSNTWDYPDEDAKDLPAYIERKVKPQLRELLTNYGPITMVWFDTYELVTKQQSTEIRELIHSLQPNCLINNRIGNGLGDYTIVEQKLMDEIKRTPWEACLTMGRNWSYNKFDTIYKNPETTIRNFVDIVSKGGNLLLNVGPTGEGIFPILSDDTFNGLQQWLNVNGEAIYGTRPWKVYGENLIEGKTEDTSQISFHDAEYDGTPKENIPDLRFTSKDNAIYIFARSIKDDTFVAKSISKDDKIKKVTLLGSNKNVKWNYLENGLQINMPSLDPNQIPVYVLKIEL